METYSVFVAFRKGRLVLRRRIGSLQEAIEYAAAQRASRSAHPEDIFVVVDGTATTLTVEAARETLARRQKTSQLERLEHAREMATRTTARAIRARERAIVASERARTVIARSPVSLSNAAFNVDRLIELTDRAAAGMMRSILLMEERLSSPVRRRD